MRKFGRHLFTLSLILVAACILALPVSVDAKTKKPAPPTTDSATTTPAAAPPANDTPPAAAADTAAPAAKSTPAAPAQTAPVRAKLIDIDDISTTALSKGSLDIYMSLTNKSKLDDALVGAETPLSEKLVLVTVKDKKETEAPLRVDLPTGKAAKLTDDKFLRISGIEKSLKDGDKFPLMLHFRSAPNVTVDVVVHKKSSFLGL